MSAAGAVEPFEEFVGLGLPVAFGAGMEGVRPAMLQVVAQRRLLDLVEGSPHGTDLGQHADAVAFVLDHARHAAHLALDAAEPGELGFFQSFIHPCTIPPYGIGGKPWIALTIPLPIRPPIPCAA